MQGLNASNIYSLDSSIWGERKGRNKTGREGVAAEEGEDTMWRHRGSDVHRGEAGGRGAARLKVKQVGPCNSLLPRGASCLVQEEGQAELHPHSTLLEAGDRSG